MQTDLSQDPRVQARLLEKLDSDLARNDTDIVRISLPEELAVHPLLLCIEV